MAFRFTTLDRSRRYGGRPVLAASLGAAALASALLLAGEASALAVTMTSDAGDLTSALVPNQAAFEAISATFTLGDARQIGVYEGFSLPPITIADGVVMSTGDVLDTPAPWKGEQTTVIGGGSTAEIDGYAPANVQNFNDAHDAAVLAVEFELADESAIAFDFIFGSVEYPNWGANYTDSFLAFLDGVQISFDANGDPVGVGTSFSGLVRTDDNNTMFTGVGSSADAHGVIPKLTTRSQTLDAGQHTLLFEIFDVNDELLDSAVFISNFRLAANAGGPVTEPEDEFEDVPEPGALMLFAAAAFAAVARRRSTT